MYKIAQISGIKNTQSPHNSLICVPVQNANPMRNPKRAKAKGVNTCCIYFLTPGYAQDQDQED